MNLTFRIQEQVDLLIEGKPLEVVDRYYSDEIIMYDNDRLFASGKEQSRSKQEPFINSAISIVGDIQELIIDQDNNISIFRNRSMFKTLDGEEIQINGLCWQQWKDGFVVVERYYSGDLMEQKISEFYS